MEDFLNFPNQKDIWIPLLMCAVIISFPLYDFVASVRVWLGIDDELQGLVARPGSDSLPDEAAPLPRPVKFLLYFLFGLTEIFIIFVEIPHTICSTPV